MISFGSVVANDLFETKPYFQALESDPSLHFFSQSDFLENFFAFTFNNTSRVWTVNTIKNGSVFQIASGVRQGPGRGGGNYSTSNGGDIYKGVIGCINVFKRVLSSSEMVSWHNKAKKKYVF